ncbi:hypothetical protein MYSTI_03331 [Myxococcus stipitatus DSM 14675]|uniref:Uncharacterized protein n=1 Tax=Myxococcus stipitatus (strain DSM 14675 / JCM 12634 / Mx s8) TaxID=1278073 RepID=L7U966_MYXSD|nr:hypothetical protein [Myxococcus stipitatus]AGC44643.1 hypothetical protein MYSTI_03331 [Myxococcus stipitatus DSM 14675]
MLLLAASSRSSGLPPWLAIAFFVVFFVGMTGLSSLVGGWYRLGRRYATKRALPDTNIRGITVRVGLSNYRGAVTVGADEEGLYLSPMFLMRPFHPPLRIPWAALRARTRRSDWTYFGKSFDRMEVGPERIVVHIESLVMDGFVRYLPPLG